VKDKTTAKTKSSGAIQVWGIMTCNSTRKALKLYDAMKLNHTFKDLKTVAPTKTLIRSALGAIDNSRKLFNTSGKSYQEGNYKEKVATMTKEQIIEVMISDPMLIKRPVVIAPNGIVVGYNEDELKKIV
jgi:arsenate reductase (glutaredoxin)